MNYNEIDRMLSDDWEGDEEIFITEALFQKDLQLMLLD